MSISRLHRKLFLILDQEYPLWKEEKFDSPAKVAEHLGIHKATYSNWRIGKAISKERLRSLCQKLIEKIKEAKYEITGVNSADKLKESLENDLEDVTDFAKRFNIDLLRCRKTIDEVIHERIPLYRSFCFSKEHVYDYNYMNKIVMPIYQGMHYMYRMRHINGNTMLVQSVLYVRYIMKVFSHPGWWAIRCKLDIPSSSVESDHIFEYDGFLCEKRRFTHWVFEQRDGRDASDDLVFMVTGRKATSSDDIHGQCLTTFGHLGNQVITSESVLVHPIDKNTPSDGIIARVYDESEWIDDEKLIVYVDCLNSTST